MNWFKRFWSTASAQPLAMPIRSEPVARSRKVGLLCFGATLVAAAPFATAAESPSSDDRAHPAPQTATADAKGVSATDGEPGAAEYWKAMKLLMSSKADEVAAGRAAIETAASREYTHAQLMLGECYANGSYGFPTSPEKAASYFRLAAERGNAFAQVSYGLSLYSGYGTMKDDSKAAEMLNAALADTADYSLPVRPLDWRVDDTTSDAEVSGELYVDPVASAKARAHHVLALLANRQGRLAEAQAHFVAAATADGNSHAGVQAAAPQAALNFAFGQGVPRDSAKAKEMLALSRTLAKRNGLSLAHNYAAAKLIDAFAVSDLEDKAQTESDEQAGKIAFDIAGRFTNPFSKEYDPKEAVQWYELAADRGTLWAMLDLAFLYSGHELGDPDLHKAFAWFAKAATRDGQKHDLAIANLVICYENGIGVAMDRCILIEHRRLGIASLLSYGWGRHGTAPVFPRAPRTAHRAPRARVDGADARGVSCT